MPVARAAPCVANGAIFQAVAYRPLFEDHRARLVGDTLTVDIVEKISREPEVHRARSTRAASSAPRSPRCRASAPTRSTAPAPPAHRATPSPARAPPRAATTSPARSPSLVTGVLPNGHLLVAGEKQIGVNANVDVLRFSGPGRPARDPARQHRAEHADRQRARRAPQPRPAGRRAGDRLAGALLPERGADMTPPRCGLRRSPQGAAGSGRPAAGAGSRGSPLLDRARVNAIDRLHAPPRLITACSSPAPPSGGRPTPARIKEVAASRACAATSWSATAWSSAWTAAATRPRRRRSRRRA